MKTYMPDGLKIWKDVVGYEGSYMVNNFGCVSSILFNRIRILKPQLLLNGYLAVGLLGKSQRIHVIVAQSFLGHVMDGGVTCINHIDGNKLNNKVENLEITTQRDNTSKGLRTKNKSSQYVGVSWYSKRNKWRADIRLRKESLTIGYFKKETDAKTAYDDALSYVLKFDSLPLPSIKSISKYRGVSFANKKWMSYFDETSTIRIFLGYENEETKALENLINSHIKYYYDLLH